MPSQKTNPLLLSSVINASSFADEVMTCTVVAYAGAPVASWEGDYLLSLDAGAVDMARVSNGAGLFLDHEHTIGAQVGVIEGATLVPGKGLQMEIRFGGHPEAARFYQGAKDGIYQNLSIGAIVLKKKDTTPEGATRRQFLATRWQPFELSLVGVPADPKARFLSLGDAPEPEDETEVQGASAPDIQAKEPIMAETTEVTGQTVSPNPELLAAAVKAERVRVSEINRIGASARMPAETIAAAIDGAHTVEAFKVVVADHLIAREPDTRVGSVAATISRDETDTRRALMATAIMARVNGASIDSSNDFRGMSCLRMAEEGLVRAGLSVRGKTPNEIAIMAMQNTADFPLVLENSARKLLLAAYEIAAPTYKMWAKQSTTPDFKTMSRTRLGEAPKFLKVPEGAQITISTMTESREQYAIATYGRGISFTRQMLINDDLGAFNDMIRAFGMQASILENKTVYAILTANAAMSDSVTLFHADHGNSGAGAIGNTGLDAMFGAMRIQKGLDAASILNIKPKFLIVPAAKEMTAKAAMKETGPNVKATDSNMFAGMLTVVADGELDASSTVKWYGAADPAMYPGVEYSHLEGANGPQMIRNENGEGILGVNLYAFLDFGAKAVDWRALYYSTGQ